MIRTYSELITLPTFIERFNYLKLNGKVGEETFGYNRYLNQIFYKSDRWLRVRDKVIERDNGCDLGIPGREIYSRVIVHHMNPLLEEDITNETEFLLDPEYLISTIKNTHDAITFGNPDLLFKEPVIRSKNDTCPWRL